MKDSQLITLEAFLYSLSQQKTALDSTLVSQIHQIAHNLESRVMDFHNLAIQTPCLKNSYQNARKFLTATSAERNMGLNFLPAENDSPNNPVIRENTTRDNRDFIHELEATLEVIERKIMPQSESVLTSPNPVQNLHQKLKET